MEYGSDVEGNEKDSADLSLDDLFCEIWERESKEELRFEVGGVGTVVQTQDLHGQRWEVNNFSNTVWEAAIWMHHFFQDERCFPVDWFRGRRVLELGAGTGLVGLTLALLGAEVTMTDLPEALPILEHNTNVTFEPMCNKKGRCKDDGVAAGVCSVMALPESRKARRPTIQQLRWGNETDIGELVTAMVAAAERRGSRWRGFDLIVGADVIYNEPTFPALVTTLSDRRLCSDTTLVYLVTMLRGGRHEGLLDQLNELFHVRALDPTSADSLRAGVEEGTAWNCPEWQPKLPQQAKKAERRLDPSIWSSGLHGDHSRRDAVTVGGFDETSSHGYHESRSSAHETPDQSEGEEKTNTGNYSEIGDTRGALLSREAPSARAVDTPEEQRIHDWSYKEKGLGKMLPFVARTRRGVEAVYSDWL